MPNVKGSSIELVLAYLHWCWQQKYLKRGDVVLMDRLDAHMSEDVQHWLKSKNIEYLYFSVATGAYLNLCDNSFHADLKHKISVLFGEHLETNLSVDHLTKLQVIMNAYQSVKDETIRNYFHHTGLLEGQTPGKVVGKLLTEGYDVSTRWKSFHENQLQAFQSWSTQVKFLRKKMEVEWSPIQLAGCMLNGSYWSNWGWTAKSVITKIKK